MYLLELLFFQLLSLAFKAYYLDIIPNYDVTCHDYKSDNFPQLRIDFFSLTGISAPIWLFLVTN